MNNNIYTVVQDTHTHTQGKHKHRHTHTQGTHIRIHIHTYVYIYIYIYIYRAAFNIIMNSFVYLPHLSRRYLLQLPIEPSAHQGCLSEQHRVFYPYHSVKATSAFFIELNK